MIVTFHHSHAHDWEKVALEDVLEPAVHEETGEALLDTETGEPLFVQRNPADVLATNVHGDLTRRFSRPSSHTTVRIAPDALDLIVAEQAAVGRRRTKRWALATLLEDGAAAERFHAEHVTDITLDPPDEALRTYLLDHFGVSEEQP